MKKLLSFLILIALSVVSMASAKTVLRYATISRNSTMLSRPMVFSAADSLVSGKGFHVVASDSAVIYITNIQDYLQYQTVTTTLSNANAAASPTITITVSGRTTATGIWYDIGSRGSWTSVSNNPIEITGTTAANYNYLKIRYVMNATSGGVVKLLTCTVKTANVYKVPTNAGTFTFTRADAGTVTLTAADNNTVADMVVTPGGTGALTIGNGTGTVAVNSSDWDISATGALTGIGAITMDGKLTAGAAIDAVGPINQAITGGTVVTSAGLLGGGGTATNATQTLGSAGGKAFSYYLSSTSTTASHVLQGYYMNVNYGATGGASAAPSGDVIRGRAYLMGDASGTTALTGGAFSVELEASTASNTGLTAGMRGNLVLPAGVLTNAGTYYGTMAEVFLGGASTDTRAYTTISPLGIVISGTAATDVAQLSNMVLMDISVPANMVTADATMIVTGATGAVAGGLKIKINGTNYWIMLAAADE